jgi:magnesium transporter
LAETGPAGVGASETSAARRRAPIALYGLTPTVEAAVRAAIAADRPGQIRSLVQPLHSADVADLLERLDDAQRRRVIDAIRRHFDPEILSHLDDSVREEVIELLGAQDVAAAVSELETDDAVDLIEDLDDDIRRRVLAALPAAERVLVEQSLTYPEESAGRLMRREVAAIPQGWTVGQTIDVMRTDQALPDDFNELCVVNGEGRLVGMVALSRLLRANRPVRVTDMMATDFKRIPPTMDREEVAFLFRQYGLVTAPVVDDAGALLGVITVDDVVTVIEEESEEDLMRLGGVGDADIHASPYQTAGRRIRWLVATFVNAVIASTVISQFEASIQQIVTLAVLMPIVAAMGGNAGMQVVTVVVRALATKELSSANALRVIGKELAVGAINGVVFAVLLGTLAGLWFANPGIGLVLAGAMVFNMLWAGLAGTLIPLSLARLGMDPAIGAGPFLTTTTDVLGFFSFLGLATLFLL